MKQYIYIIAQPGRDPAAAVQSKVDLITKQSSNIDKMLATLSEVYNPPGDYSELFGMLIHDIVR